MARARRSAEPPPTLLLNQHQVRRLLSMKDCIKVMEDAFRALGRGNALQPLRPLVRLPNGRGLLGLMPAFLGAPAGLGVKVLSVFPGNHGTRLDSHQGAVLLFHPDDGRLLAIMDATEITAVRTAAVSALATRFLAAPRARRLAIIGSGVQARTHLDAMRCVRRIDEVGVFSLHAANARAFAAREGRRTGLAIEAAPSAARALRDADVICTTTSARDPVVRSEWIADGAHVNAVGASTPSARELDTRLMARARLFVDLRESALAEAGDFLIPRAEGAITDDHIQGELADLVLGRVAGRKRPGDVTVFKSVGLGIEDVAVARHLHARAASRRVGRRLVLGGARQAKA